MQLAPPLCHVTIKVAKVTYRGIYNYSSMAASNLFLNLSQPVKVREGRELVPLHQPLKQPQNTTGGDGRRKNGSLTRRETSATTGAVGRSPRRIAADRGKDIHSKPTGESLIGDIDPSR